MQVLGDLGQEQTTLIGKFIQQQKVVFNRVGSDQNSILCEADKERDGICK